MKKLTITLFLLSFVFCIENNTVAQSDISVDTKFDVKGNWGITDLEKQQESISKSHGTNIPQNLIQQYISAKHTKNENEKMRLANEIQTYLEQTVLPEESGFKATFSTGVNNQPIEQDWYNNDVMVHNGLVARNNSNFRTIDLKQGEDGWMYLCVGRININGSQDGITVYTSSNNGATWPNSFTLTFSSWKLFSLSMLVENRSSLNSNGDSTRVLVYFTTASAISGDNAQLWVWSTRRNGTSSFNQAAGIPAAGNKLEYVTACSDGRYYDVFTYMHAVVREATNAGAQVGLRHYFTTNWGVAHSNVLINTGYNDYYPSCAYGEKNGSDSIYIAIERRFSATDYDIRVIATPEVPNANTHTYYITSGSNIKYEKPCITVVQQQYSVPKKMVVTCTRNNIARYHYSLNGGTTWAVDLNLTSVGLRDYTWCASDSNTTLGGYIVMCTVDQNGDSVTVRRGTPTAMGTYLYKRNSIMSTGLLTPVCAIVKSGNTLNSSFTYAGQGPNNIYFNQEALVTGIEPIGNHTPDKFELSQNYPNPFNPVTNINFSIPKSEFVKLSVFDITGKEVTVLVDKQLNAGSYKVDFDASRFASGVYFYRINAGDYIHVKKMMLVK